MTTQSDARPSKSLRSRKVIIESPRGSRNRYKLNDRWGRFELIRVMPDGVVFPFDLGFLPGTEDGDGDALDVVVLNEEGTFSGCLIESRVIGAMRSIQGFHKNDYIVAVAIASILYSDVRDISSLSSVLVEELEMFFNSLKEANGVKGTPLGIEGAMVADELIEQARAPIASLV